MWDVPKLWKDQDVYIIGGGASLSGFNFKQLRDKNVIGCNDAFRLGADIVKLVLFGDASWFHKNKWHLESFPGNVVTCCPSLMHLRLPWLKRLLRERDGFYTGSTIGWNYSTGAAAINLAINLGAKRVFLLGFDLGRINGQTHYHKLRNTQDSSFIRFGRGFNTLAEALKISAPEVEVINVTDGSSSLKCFPSKTFMEVFA